MPDQVQSQQVGAQTPVATNTEPTAKPTSTESGAAKGLAGKSYEEQAAMLKPGVPSQAGGPDPLSAGYFDQLGPNTRGGFCQRLLKALGNNSSPALVLNSGAYERPITRAETASLIARVRNMGDGLAGQPGIYNDVPLSHWAAAAIYRCREEGIFSGAGQNMFMPDEPLQEKHVDLILQRVVNPQASAGFDRDAAVKEAEQNRPAAQGDGAGDMNANPTFTKNVYEKHKKMVPEADLQTTGYEGEIAAFQKIWKANKARYEKVASQVGLPAILIAALHFREGSGNFNTYLHQGDPLGKPPVHWPTNIPTFYVWEDSAVHALNLKKSIAKDVGLTVSSTDLAAMATYAEYYNGLGYHNKGRVSPYVYSATDQYTKGKYVADGVFDPNTRDRQAGILAMIQSGGGPEASGTPLEGQLQRQGQVVADIEVVVVDKKGQRSTCRSNKNGFFEVSGGVQEGEYQVTAAGVSQPLNVVKGKPAWLKLDLTSATIPEEHPESTTTPSTEANTTTTPTPEPTPTPAATGFGKEVLRQGSKGENVRQLQLRLVAHGYKISADGDFGPLTDKAVRDFQKKNGLTPDGEVGPLTTAALLQSSTTTPEVAKPQTNPTTPTQPTQDNQPQTNQPQTQLPQADKGGFVEIQGIKIGPFGGTYQGQSRAQVIADRLKTLNADDFKSAQLKIEGNNYVVHVGTTQFTVTADDVALNPGVYAKEFSDRYTAVAAHFLSQMGAPLPKVSLAGERARLAAKSARIEYKSGVAQHGEGKSWETAGTNQGPIVNKFKEANHAGGKNEYEWCGMFVGYQYKQAGIRSEILKNLVFWSGYRLNTFMKSGGYVGGQGKAGSWWQPHKTLQLGSVTGAKRKEMLAEFNPQPGDIALFRSDYSHVAIVVSYNSSTGQLELIEGNRGNRVQATAYGTGDGQITFLGRFNDSDYEPGGTASQQLIDANEPTINHTNVAGGTT